MKQKTFDEIVVFFFSALAIVHALRLINGWPANIGGLVVPMWISWVAMPVAAFLAYQGIKLIDNK